MSYNVTQLKADLSGVIHGTSLNKVQNLNGLIKRAASQLLLELDPQETIRFAQMTTPLYDQVYDYALPSDLKGDKIIDIFPQGQRNYDDYIPQTYLQSFDLAKDNYISGATIKWNGGVKTIRIKDKTLPAAITIDTCDSITGWSGTVTNITQDVVNYASGSSSISFDVSQPSNYIEKTLDNVFDLSGQQNKTSFFFFVYMPVVMTNVEFRWGNDANNYYTRTITTTNEGNAFSVGWNLLRADWNGAGTLNSPSSSTIDYVRIVFNTADNAISTRIDNIILCQGEYMNIAYYSKYLFRDNVTGAFTDDVEDSYLVNLDTETRNLLLNLVAYYSAQQIQGGSASFDVTFFEKEYLKSLERYKNMYKAQTQKPQQVYYQSNGSGYGRYLNGRF